MCHEKSSFWTLTFAEQPYSVSPVDIKKFMDRLRKRFPPASVRFFGVGEYGDKSFRPHYHIALFGVGVEDKEKVEECWTNPDTGEITGFVAGSPLDHGRAGYISGYTVKKLTKMDDDRLSEGMHPEFARMSNRPGMGALAIPLIAKTIDGTEIIDRFEDVPKAIRLGGRVYPLGKYLRSKLRKEVGFTDEYIQELSKKFFSEKSEEMSEMLEAAEMDVSTWQSRSHLLADMDALRAEKQKQKYEVKNRRKTL